jgi:DNA-binding ferritin-like protein
MDKLLAMLKIIENNIGVLHRHVVGPNWFQSHEKLEEYCKYVGEVKDDVTEIALTLGFREPSLRDALEVYKEIPSPITSYNEIICFEDVKQYFRDLVSEIENVRKMIPADVAAKFDEYQYFFRKEAEYKLQKLSK